MMLEKFTVIDLIKTRSASVATITGNTVKFNAQTASEMHYTPFVQFLVNAKEKQFAIRTCKEDAPNAIPFSKAEGAQRGTIRVNSPAIVDMIRKMAGWKQEGNWKVPGIYFADENALMYDLSAAHATGTRGGAPRKRAGQASDDGEVDDE